eukprot:2813789-Pleurochrysis_carterae.AAC.1
MRVSRATTSAPRFRSSDGSVDAAAPSPANATSTFGLPLSASAGGLPCRAESCAAVVHATTAPHDGGAE